MFICFVMASVLSVVGQPLADQPAVVADHQPFADQSQVTISSSGFDLFGSMVVPSGDSVESIVIILPNSSQTDRDGNQKMIRNNAYRMLSVILASHNIASLRYDKRGVGASRGPNQSETSYDFGQYVEDAKNWVNYIRRTGMYKKIILIGHGEGALIGLAALNEGVKVDAFVAINGMGRSFDQVLKDQLSEEPYYVRNISNHIIDSLKNGQNVSFVPFYLSPWFRPQLQPLLKSIMKYDPQKLIRNVNVPIMIIQGDTDLEVKVEDARLLHAANANSSLIIIVGMNHVMKNCISTQRSEQIPIYVNPTLPISQGLIDVLLNFIDQK